MDLRNSVCVWGEWGVRYKYLTVKHKWAIFDERSVFLNKVVAVSPLLEDLNWE